MRTPEHGTLIALLLGMTLSAPALAGLGDGPEAEQPVDRDESPGRHSHAESPETPPLPDGMSLDEVLERASNAPPEHYPHPVMDSALHVFTLFEQLETRTADDANDHLGWEAQGWAGGDFDKFWWKSEGALSIEGPQGGDLELDLLYSRLIRPFWSLQVGTQLAREWDPNDSAHRWSGVVALQGLAPYRFELDGSLYLSEDGDVTLEVETEYDLRVTQRLVAQPRLEVSVAAQDVAERRLGAGVTAIDLGLRWRYEIRRELAPYVGLQYETLLGQTRAMAAAAGEDPGELRFLAGLRFAF